MTRVHIPPAPIVPARHHPRRLTRHDIMRDGIIAAGATVLAFIPTVLTMVHFLAW